MVKMQYLDLHINFNNNILRRLTSALILSTNSARLEYSSWGYCYGYLILLKLLRIRFLNRSYPGFGVGSRASTMRSQSTVRPRAHSSNKHCVAVYRPISTRFSAFFQKRLLFQTHYIVLIFVASWCHNFREIAAKNREKFPKSAQKFVYAPLGI